MVSNVASLEPDSTSRMTPLVGDHTASLHCNWPATVIAAMAAIRFVAAVLIALTVPAVTAGPVIATVARLPTYVRPRPLRPDVAVRQDTTVAS